MIGIQCAVNHKGIFGIGFLKVNFLKIVYRKIRQIRSNGREQVLCRGQVAHRTMDQVVLIIGMGQHMQPCHFHGKEKDKEKIGNVLF